MTNLDRWHLFMRDIESPNCFIDWGFYHLISSALQRRVWMCSDPVDFMPASYSLFANQFITLVGPPAVGKGRVIAQEASIIKSPGLERPGPTGEKLSLIPYSPDKTTVEALTRHVAQSVKSLSRKHPADPSKNQAYAYCPCSFLIEELEVLFSEHANDMASVLQHLWDSGHMHYKTKQNGEDKIRNVCVSMIAGTTPKSIRDLMTKKILGKGLMSRMIFVFADEARFYREFRGIDMEQYKAYMELLAHVVNLTKIFGEVVMSPEAKDYHVRFYESGEMAADRINKEPILDDYYGRKNVHWKKLMMALLYADQTESNVITLEMVKRAYSILKENEIRMHESFSVTGNNPLYEVALKLERFLKDNGSTTHKKLWWELSKDTDKAGFEEIINLLCDTGRIRNDGAGNYVINPARNNNDGNKGI